MFSLQVGICYILPNNQTIELNDQIVKINNQQDVQLGIESVGHIGKDSTTTEAMKKALLNYITLFHPKVL